MNAMRLPDTEVVTVDPSHDTTVTTVSRLTTILVAGALALVLAASQAGAHDDGTTAHLWETHIAPMADPGQINASTNPVDWTKLKGVPADFADGNDAGVESAGFGLGKYYTLFFVDWTKVQRRVKTTCPSGQAMRSIDQQGAAVCSVGPRALSTTVTSTGWFCDADCTESTLTLTAGTWYLSATMNVIQAQSWIRELKVDCHLDAGGLSDNARISMPSWGGGDVAMQLIATVGRGGLDALVRCRDHNVGQALGYDLTITAIRLD